MLSFGASQVIRLLLHKKMKSVILWRQSELCQSPFIVVEIFKAI